MYHVSCSRILLKMTKLPKAIYRFSTFSIKIPVVFFYKTRASNSKIFMEMQKKKKKNLKKAKIILRKNKSGSITLSYLLNGRKYFQMIYLIRG